MVWFVMIHVGVRGGHKRAYALRTRPAGVRIKGRTAGAQDSCKTPAGAQDEAPTQGGAPGRCQMMIVEV